MGYISKQIVEDTIKPAKVSLSGVSNFLELTAKKDGNYTYKKTEIKLEIKLDTYSDEDVSNTKFTITEKYNEEQAYTFIGTKNPEEVDDRTFLLVDNDKSVVAENIRACLLKNPFFKNKFNITIPFLWNGNQVSNGHTIVIESLGAGELYKFRMEVDETFVKLEGDPESGDNDDGIDYGLGDKDIEIDVYTNTGVFLGMPDHSDNTVSPGKLLTTMSKSYFGQPIWFDINALMGTNKVYSDEFLQSGEKDEKGNIPVIWTDTGTVSDVRMIAKTHDGTKRETFYYSNVLYAVTGYARTLDEVDMNNYIFRRGGYNSKKMQLLTNQPVLTHIKGQRQYLNFIFSDSTHGAKNQTDLYNIGLFYELYTQSGILIAEKRSLMQGKDSFKIVNTVRVDIDDVIEKTEAENEDGLKVGIVKVYLCDDKNIASHPLEFRIVPECLYKVRDFAFLNALGGWSSFSFGGERTVTVKSEPNTIYKTVVPGYTTSSQIESVFDKEIKETYTIKTLPITAEVADWLKELTASIAVYEIISDEEKRYIVIDDFEIKHTSKNDLFVLEMKYHYSDTYNGVIR